MHNPLKSNQFIFFLISSVFPILSYVSKLTASQLLFKRLTRPEIGFEIMKIAPRSAKVHPIWFVVAPTDTRCGVNIEMSIALQL